MHHPVRRKLIGLIFLCLAVRVIMPAGYMPAAIGEGGPFVLCPGGLTGATAILSSLSHAGGHHGDLHGDGLHFWEFCPFDAAFGTAIVDNDIEVVLPAFRQFFASARPQLAPRPAAPHPFHARAPPLLTSPRV